MSPPLIRLENVSKRFVRELDAAERVANLLGAHRRPVIVHAVDDVSLDIADGEVVGLVGESGCGKSTLGRVVAGIHAQSEGRVLFKGEDRDALTGRQARAAALAVQMIFQDPFASLNPRMRVAEIVGEAPKVHKIDCDVPALLRKVGLDAAMAKRFPHQFSGGQRQRIGIARALAVRPELIVCDEAIAALDVSIQAQVINLFMDLRREFGLTYLFISHDLGVVEHISERIVIMYLGRVVEMAPTEALYRDANHPYTQALLAEIPRIATGRRRFHPIKGEIPSPIDPPPGCHFHPRCPHAFERCRIERPALKEIAPGRLSACHLNDEPR